METPRIIVIDEFVRSARPHSSPVEHLIQALAELDESSDRR